MPKYFADLSLLIIKSYYIHYVPLSEKTPSMQFVGRKLRMDVRVRERERKDVRDGIQKKKGRRNRESLQRNKS